MCNHETLTEYTVLDAEIVYKDGRPVEFGKVRSFWNLTIGHLFRPRKPKSLPLSLCYGKRARGCNLCQMHLPACDLGMHDSSGCTGRV